MIISYNGLILSNNGPIVNYTEPPSIYDPNAQTFFTAANITNTTEKTAVNQLVLDFKSYGIWNKMLGLYPRVGLVESSQKVNLKSPGTFDSIYTGSWVFSNSGSTPNAIDTYIETGISTPDNLQKTNCSFGVYLNSPYSTTPGSVVKTHFGFSEQSELTNSTVLNAVNVTKQGWIESFSAIGSATASNITHQGFWAISRSSLSDFSFIGPTGGITNNNTTIPAPTNTSLPIIFAARKYLTQTSPDFFDIMRHAFDYASIGLTNTELTNLRTAVINFQTTLGRNV